MRRRGLIISFVTGAAAMLAFGRGLPDSALLAIAGGGLAVVFALFLWLLLRRKL